MSIVLKAGAGMVAGAVAGALGLAFLPHVEPSAVQPRSAVEKPKFVVAAVVAAPTPQPSATLAQAIETPAPKATAPSPVATLASVAAPAPSSPAGATRSVAMQDASRPKPEASTPAVDPQKAAVQAAPSAEASARWSVRGLAALARGDLSSARLFLTRAAEAGDARALVALADSYDPAVLAKLGVAFAPGDAARARDYLMKAVAAGAAVPKDRLAALDSARSEVR